MNVLTYVMTILLLLSSLTYARFENFRTTSGLQASFISYMETRERKPVSDLAEIWYHNLRATRQEVKTGEDKKKETRSKIRANSRLSFHLFLNKLDRDANPNAYLQTRELAKQLMTTLYQDQVFFKEILARRPNFLNEILDQIELAAENLSPENKITKATRLSILEFNDKDLHHVFYLMLKGLPKPLPKPIDPTVVIKAEQNGADDTEDPIAAIESQEAHAPAGYVSLVDYLTLKSYLKTRVFLASRPLLTAIYQNADIVNTIIETRNEMYNAVNNDSEQTTPASIEFLTRFQAQGMAAAYAEILNFDVSNTDPKKYE